MRGNTRTWRGKGRRRDRGWIAACSKPPRRDTLPLPLLAQTRAILPIFLGYPWCVPGCTRIDRLSLNFGQFYSEAILSRRGPLAKVWLAAHMERKLSKTQTLQTDIEQSVGTFSASMREEEGGA